MKTLHLLTIILFLILQCNDMAVECLLIRRSMKTSGNETDRVALLALKAGLVGGYSESPALSSWNASVHFCKWAGVTCDGGQQRVTVLDLAYNNMGGFISPSIGNLSFLRVINLRGNRLQGFIPKEIGLLSRLEVFNVSYNALQGGFPPHLSNCTRLLTISCFTNELTGLLPDQLGCMPNLQTLSLGVNDFTGQIPSSLGNISSLIRLGLEKNRLQGSIPSNFGKLQSLTYMSLFENLLSGTIPSSFYNLTNLSRLTLDGNQFSGTLAPSMGLQFPNLREAYFGGNSFTGVIPPTLSNMSSLQDFEVGENHFYGNVPEGLGRLQYLEYFTLGRNNLGTENEGDLNFLTNLTSLKTLSIYRNRFGGMIPNSIGNLSSKIERLVLGFNTISGHIPVEIGNLISLVSLGMNDNILTGELPSSIGNLVMLQKLTLGGNRLEGTIPSTLGNLKNLYALGLEMNWLEGGIPLDLQHCFSLQKLYLNGNKLKGTISMKLISSLNQLIELNLNRNYFSGYLPASVGKLINLNYLGISNNMFSGEIPRELGQCLMLEFLWAQANSFEGRIPSSLGSLKGVQYLDLSSNNLSGGIPPELQNLSSLQFLNISFNQLEGPVPTEGIFSNLTRFSLHGNEKLCGGIPQLHLHNCSSTNRVKNEKRRNMSTMVIIAMTMSILFGFVLVSIFTWVVCRKMSKRNDAATISLVGEGQYLRLSYKQLWDATDGFSVDHIIGVGSFGSVYSGILGDIPIAVKVMNLEKHGAIKSFKTECKALSNIRHRNLLRILSCCSSLDFKGNEFMALVFGLMPNGSLESWLHGSRSLNLSQRMDVAIDIASALEYLHHDCEPQILHCDLKPSNVLLDGDMVAHVGDFGLAKILRGAVSSKNFSQEQSISSFGIKGTVGYVPPEYGMGGNVSTKGDMYSFGILLLEMVTGRRPTDEIFEDITSLQNFCKSKATNSNIFDLVDFRLVAELHSENDNYGTNPEDMNAKRAQDCCAAIIEVGVACSSDSPNERTDIREAIKVLHNIKINFLGRRVDAGRQNARRLADEDALYKLLKPS